MNYTIEILEKESELLTKCLTEWETKEYPIAKEIREIRLKELNNALELLKK